jgi:hypothetical protein
LDAGSLKVDLSGSDTTTKRFSVSGANSSAPVNIYDVRNNLRITNSSFSTDTLRFNAKSNAKLEIANGDITQKPFRIKQKTVPNLVTNATGADYIILYNRMFESQAEAIRSYRQSYDGLRSFKAEIEDVYDVYNYGMENPSAVRLFFKTAYDNWATPKLKYVCLFGRGSLDPKNGQSLATFYGNIVPVYGNPNSDNYFVTFNLNSTIYSQNIAIGRLPAFTVAEAEIMKNKIINYNSQPLDDWAKRFILVTGGVSQSEQSYFQSISNTYANTYIKPKPLAGNIDKIYRVDGQGGTTYNFQDSIVNDFNRGALVINYSGHAGNGTWDQGLEDPNLLSNGPRFPLLFSMTCFTAKNSDPATRGFGEKFFMYDNKGAIGYIGCTGWAFTTATNVLNTYLYAALKDSAFRRQGDLLRSASTIMKSDSANFSSRISLECFNFLGDPAQKLVLPSYPEFSIKDADYKISDANPVTGQNVRITAYPKNLGTFADSMKVKFQVLKNNLAYKSRDTVIRNFGFADSVMYNFSLDTLGIYFVRVSLDPDNWYTQEDPNNNVINIPVNLKNNSFVPLKPVSNSVIKTDTVYFTCLNPDSDPAVNSISLTLQLDTVNTFTNPITFINNSPAGVFSKFQTVVPVKDSNVTYYWRTNASINGNISGWSQTQTFTYNTRTFSNSPIERMEPLDSSIVLYLKSKNQFNEANFNNIVYQSGGLTIPQISGVMRGYSLGNNGEESSFFIVNSSQINIGQSLNPGLNILKVRRVDMKIQELRNFRFNSATSADSVATYLNAIDSSNFIMVVKALVTTSNSMNASCKAAFRQFGSVYADSLPSFNNFWTWSFIGYKGANSSQISEEFHRNNSSNSCASNWCPSNAYLPVKYVKTFGTAVVNLGPAQNWKKFGWEQVTSTGNSIAADVYGVKKDNTTTLLYSNVTNPAGFNLDTLNAYTYPNINLVLKFNLDTLTAAPSPIVKTVTSQYNPPYEAVMYKSSFHCKDSIVKLGQKVKIDFRFFNSGYKDISKFYVNWYYFPFTPGRKVLRADTISAFVAVDSSYKVTQDIIIPRDNSPLIAPTSTTIYAEVIPYGNSNEFYTYNNTGQINFRIISTPILPVADVYFDGNVVKNGDYVRKNPEVKIRINDAGSLFSSATGEAPEKQLRQKSSGLITNDSSNVKIYINKQYIPYHNSGKVSQMIKAKGLDNSSSDNIELNFTPDLSFGDNQLMIVLTDNNGAKVDSLMYDVVVSNELFVKDFYNYPNPVSRETNFVFNIAAQTKPHDCKIKIYTVSGKLIKEIIAPLNVGYNQIPWDIRDVDGDMIANGVYLYKMVVEDDIKTETAIQKLVVLK